MLWPIAAALCSPPLTAWAATHRLGAARSSSAIKLSASDVRALPLPRAVAAWEQAEEACVPATCSSRAASCAPPTASTTRCSRGGETGFPAAAEELDEERPHHRHAVGHEQVVERCDREARRRSRSSASTTSPSSNVNGPSSRATYRRTIVRTLVVLVARPADLDDRRAAADLLGELAHCRRLPRPRPSRRRPRRRGPTVPATRPCHRPDGGSAHFRPRRAPRCRPSGDGGSGPASRGGARPRSRGRRRRRCRRGCRRDRSLLRCAFDGGQRRSHLLLDVRERPSHRAGRRRRSRASRRRGAGAADPRGRLTRRDRVGAEVGGDRRGVEARA